MAVCAILAALVLNPFEGGIVLALTSAHGLHLGDLALLVPVAVVTIRRRWRPDSVAIRPPVRDHAHLAVAALGAALSALGGWSLYAGSERAASTAVDLAATMAVVALMVWVIWTSVRQPSAEIGARLPLSVVLAGFALGLAIDLALVPTGTAWSAVFLASGLAVRSPRRVGRPAFVVLGLLVAACNVASMADISGVDVVLANSGGGAVRSTALGTVLVFAALVRSPL